LVPPLWWRDTKFAEPIALTAEQIVKLEALAPKQENVARLESEAQVAARELRAIVDMPEVTTAQIVESGHRLRDARSELLEAQVDLVAAQRAILSIDQWIALERAVQEQRRSQRGEERGRGRGGFGGGPGGGRPPGGGW
jgi:hypothetical protein